MQWAKGEYRFKSTDEFWLVVDRDDWETIHKLSFEQLVNDCQEEGNFYLAMSNPCFEIWLLLHLVDLDELDESQQRLIFQNAKVSNAKTYICLVLAKFQEKDYNKRPDPAIYLPLTHIAIERAKKLDQLEETYPKKLGTHIYKLVDKLIKQDLTTT